jgi:PST family polysaccharide transporter
MKGFTKLKQQAKANRGLIANFGYLSVLQVLNLVLPLVTYPYLIRVLGSEVFGTVIFAQAIAAYFSMIINYGFNITATRDISVNRHNPEKIKQIVSGVLTVKAGLWVVSLLLLLILVLVIPQLSADKWLYILSFGICFQELLLPVWYFQGTEKMKYITIFQFVSRVSFVVLIFLFVNQPHHYLLVPVFYGLGALMGGTGALALLFSLKDVQFIRQPLSYLKALLKDGLAIFFSRISSVITERANVLVIGSFLGMSQVAYYDFAIKVLHALKVPADILVQTVFPRIAQTQSKKLALRQLLLSLSWGIVTVAILWIWAEPITQVVGGNQLGGAQRYLYYVAPLVLITCVSYSMGQPYLVAFGHIRLFSKVVIAANTVYIIGIVLLMAFQAITIVNCLLLLALSELANLSLRFIFSYKNKLFA